MRERDHDADKVDVVVVVNVLAFVGFSIALLAKAPKASASFVFVDVINETGYVHGSSC